MGGMETKTVIRDGREFRVTVLPDDPQTTEAAARKRQGQHQVTWRKGRFAPRSMTKNHQHHLVTECAENQKAQKI